MHTRQVSERTRRQRLPLRLSRLSPVRLLPPETQVHLRNATREQLLALRSLIDVSIRRLERPETKRHETRTHVASDRDPDAASMAHD